MKILVVDDEKDIEPLFKQRFRKEIQRGELDFAFALSGEQALQYLHEHLSEVVLILSDINMPGMSGIELLRRIRGLYPVRPPVVMMLTAYSDEQTYNQAMQYGADDFLTKPLDFNDLKIKLSSSV
jgi:two-component system, chemotaxis family, chemotaxis protein CheY